MAAPETEQEAKEVLPPYFEWVGRVASVWSELEQVIDDAIWTLAGVEHHKGACITSQLATIYSRLSVLISLVELHGGSDDLLAKIRKAARKARGLAKDRNKIVHDPVSYHVQKKIAIISRISTRESVLEMDLVSADLDHYKKITRSIGKFRSDFIELRDEIYDELHKFVDKFQR